MNAVWNSYGQLCGCPEIFKKSCKFFCRELDIRVSNIMHASFCRWENFITLFSTKYRYKKAAATLTAPFIVIEHIMYGVTVRWKLPSWSSEADFQSV